MTKKYKFTKETIKVRTTTLHRIVALRDFGAVKKGDLGGFIQKHSNLSHEGDAWVYGDARVSGEARVYGDARVYGNARVSGNAWVFGKALVYGREHISKGRIC